jgi:hypothetical protein
MSVNCSSGSGDLQLNKWLHQLMSFTGDAVSVAYQLHSLRRGFFGIKTS